MGEYNAGYGVFVNNYDCGSAQGGTPVWYAWTYKAGANGTFRLVNRQSGHCLDPNGTVGGTAVACDGSSDQSWRVQATTSRGRTLMNVGNGQCLVAGPPFMMMAACDPGDLRQLWRNVSPV
ncbi:RICIN domain-containing protein [Streptomyces sp. NPDC004288]